MPKKASKREMVRLERTVKRATLLKKTTKKSYIRPEAYRKDDQALQAE
ncbi:MAG: hypothetical protein HYZ16_12100 [Bacteroidetes bacterium]|jgi:hypothetical protein|nr:hypothetical protein [Bacteroidota bacterium]